MRTYIKTAITLFLICAVCATLCGVVNSITAPVIAENQRNTDKKALAAVSGGLFPGDTVEVDGMDSINTVTPLYKDSSMKELGGYSLNLTGKGYGGEFTIIASYYLDGSLISAKMTSDSETAGLGKKAENDWYMAMFSGLGGNDPLPESKNDLNDSNAEIVSGATITFTGVSNALRIGSEYAKEAR